MLPWQLQGHEIADPDWRNASQDIKDGLSNMLPAARTRANATYYGFIVLSIGLIVMVRHLSTYTHNLDEDAN